MTDTQQVFIRELDLKKDRFEYIESRAFLRQLGNTSITKWYEYDIEKTEKNKPAFTTEKEFSSIVDMIKEGEFKLQIQTKGKDNKLKTEYVDWKKQKCKIIYLDEGENKPRLYFIQLNEGYAGITHRIILKDKVDFKTFQDMFTQQWSLADKDAYLIEDNVEFYFDSKPDEKQKKKKLATLNQIGELKFKYKEENRPAFIVNPAAYVKDIFNKKNIYRDKSFLYQYPQNEFIIPSSIYRMKHLAHHNDEYEIRYKKKDQYAVIDVFNSHTHFTSDKHLHFIFKDSSKPVVFAKLLEYKNNNHQFEKNWFLDKSFVLSLHNISKLPGKTLSAKATHVNLSKYTDNRILYLHTYMPNRKTEGKLYVITTTDIDTETIFSKNDFIIDPISEDQTSHTKIIKGQLGNAGNKIAYLLPETQNKFDILHVYNAHPLFKTKNINESPYLYGNDVSYGSTYSITDRIVSHDPNKNDFIHKFAIESKTHIAFTNGSFNFYPEEQIKKLREELTSEITDRYHYSIDEQNKIELIAIRKSKLKNSDKTDNEDGDGKKKSEEYYIDEPKRAKFIVIDSNPPADKDIKIRYKDTIVKPPTNDKKEKDLVKLDLQDYLFLYKNTETQKILLLYKQVKSKNNKTLHRYEIPSQITTAKIDDKIKSKTTLYSPSLDLFLAGNILKKEEGHFFDMNVKAVDRWNIESNPLRIILSCKLEK